ncbi:MAG: ATP-binding protein [Deltaproteobacteria bacterium]|nr:ATP-binding protein [Deltaproteobacteria bacterium]
MTETGAKFLFQVIVEKMEKTAVIITTTKLACSEWIQVIPNARLCKALIDRIADDVNISRLYENCKR